MKTIQIPQEYKRLFDKDWREASVYGGRYSLKSHTVARVLLIRGRQEKLRIACFREFQNSISESSHQLLSDLINMYELYDYVITDKTITNKITGTDFIFKGLHHNEQNIKSTEGIDIAWVEEAQTISKSSIDILTPTVRKEGSQIIYTYNRLMEDDPVHTRLVIEGRPNTLVLNVNYDVAQKYGFIPDVILREIEDDKVNRPALYKHKWLGEPATLESRIYKDWAIIDSIPHEARLERYGLDFGYTNDPSALVAIYYYNGGYIVDEILYGKGIKNKEIAETLLNLPRAIVVADSAEPKSIAEIKDYRINIIGVSKTKNETRTQTFKKWSIANVQNSKISVTNTSTNVIKEYHNYLWQTDKEGKILNEPEHEYSHSMNAIEYPMTTITTIARKRELYVSSNQPPRQRSNVGI